MSELISQAEYARRNNWSRAYVTQLVQAGRIDLIEGKIDPEKADASVAATAHPAYTKKEPAPSGSGQSGDYLRARTMKEVYGAQIQKLEYEKMLDKLVDRSNVEQEGFDAGHATRERLLFIPPRISDRLARMDDPAEIEDFLEAEIIETLEALTEAITPNDGASSALAG